MKNPFKEGEDLDSSQGNQNAVTLTASMFFDQGYFTPDEWIQYGKDLRPTEVADLGRLIAQMSLGGIMTGLGQSKTDVGKRAYAYPQFIKPKGRVGVKVILEGGIQQFIEDYQDGKITVEFTLDDLVAEARKRIADAKR